MTREIPMCQRWLFGIEHLYVPAASAKWSLLGVDIRYLANQLDPTAHGFAGWLVDPLFVRVGFSMPLPLLQIIGQRKRQRVPRWWEVYGYVSLNTPFTDKLKHSDLGKHGDAIQPID